MQKLLLSMWSVGFRNCNKRIRQGFTCSLFRSTLHTVILNISKWRLARHTDFFGMRRKYSLTRYTLSSNTRGRPAPFPLQRNAVVWVLIPASSAIGRSLLDRRRNARWTETSHSCFTNCSTKRFLLRNRHYRFVTSQTDRQEEGGIAHAHEIWTLLFRSMWGRNSACVLKTVMADWNRSNHFDTRCTSSTNPIPQYHITCHPNSLSSYTWW